MSRVDFLQPEPVASEGDDGAARFRRVAEAPVRPRDPVAALDLAPGIAGEAGRADQAPRAVGAAEDEEACLLGPSPRIEEGPPLAQFTWPSGARQLAADLLPHPGPGPPRPAPAPATT